MKKHPNDLRSTMEIRGDQGRKKPTWVKVLVSLLIGAILILGFYFNEVYSTPPEEMVNGVLVVRDPYIEVTVDYLIRHQGNQDQFWLTGTEPPEVAFQIMEERKRRFQEFLEEFKGISSLATEIHKTFGNLRVTKFFNGVSEQIHMGNVGSSIDGFEVCMIPQNMMRHPSLHNQASTYYRQDWEAVMVSGFKVPGSIDGATLYHELGHALRHQQGRTSSTAATGTDDYIGEEVEMHELEKQIMDHASNMKFGQLLEEIVSRGEAPKTFADILNKMTKDDLVKFDTMFGLRTAGELSIASSIAQFHLSLVFAGIEKYLPSEKWMEQKIGAYRFLTATVY